MNNIIKEISFLIVLIMPMDRRSNLWKTGNMKDGVAPSGAIAH